MIRVLLLLCLLASPCAAQELTVVRGNTELPINGETEVPLETRFTIKASFPDSTIQHVTFFWNGRRLFEAPPPFVISSDHNNNLYGERFDAGRHRISAVSDSGEFVEAELVIVQNNE